MSQIMQIPKSEVPIPIQAPFKNFNGFSPSLPRDLDGQLRNLKTSISHLDKKPMKLNNTYDPNQETNLKSEIVKLNKEILSLQSDLYKLNTKYIAKGLLSPSKTSYLSKKEDFLTPQRTFPMDSESTVRPEFNQNNRILNEINILIDNMNRINPILLTKFFNSPDNLRRMSSQNDHSTILLSLLQLFNEFIITNNNYEKSIRNDSLDKYEFNKYRLNTSQQAFEFEKKPIDFKNYFKNSFPDTITQGCLKKPQKNQLRKPTSYKKPIITEESNPKTLDSSLRESRYSLDRNEQPYKLYNNRSESERFLNEEQGMSIDDIPHRKKIRQVMKKKRNVDIITNLPKKQFFKH